jgi:hypothetical protein
MAKDNKRLKDLSLEVGQEVFVRVVSFQQKQPNSPTGTAHGVLVKDNAPVVMFDMAAARYHNLPPSRVITCVITTVLMEHIKNQGRHQMVIVAKPKLWSLAEHLVGPENKIVTPDAYLEMVKDGCNSCKQIIRPNDHRALHWVKDTKGVPKPVCSDCHIKTTLAI